MVRSLRKLKSSPVPASTRARAATADSPAGAACETLPSASVERYASCKPVCWVKDCSASASGSAGMSVRKGWPGEGSLGAAARTQPPRQQYSAIAAIGRNREPIPLSCVPDGRGRRDSLTPGRRDFEDVRQLFDPHTL